MDISSDMHMVLLLPQLDPIGLVPVIITTFEFSLVVYYYCGNLCDPTINLIPFGPGPPIYLYSGLGLSHSGRSHKWVWKPMMVSPYRLVYSSLLTLAQPR